MKDYALIALIMACMAMFTALLASVAGSSLERSQANYDNMVLLHKIDNRLQDMAQDK